MNHKKRHTIFWLALALILVSVLLLAWPPLLTHAGPELPPRKPPTPTRPPGDDDKDDKPAGAHIVLYVSSPPAGLQTIVQWQDSTGGWHDIEGWQGTLDEGYKKGWWVAPDLFGKGPFRWLVYQGQEGELIAQSDLFNLPYSAGETVEIEVSLMPSQPTQRSTSVSTLPYPSPDGSYIELHVYPPQPGLWAIVQWQDSAGGWHDIEGWQGTLDNGYQRWWVASKDFDTGPFRWVAISDQDGAVIGTSESFRLPAQVKQIVRVEMLVK